MVDFFKSILMDLYFIVYMEKKQECKKQAATRLA